MANKIFRILFIKRAEFDKLPLVNYYGQGYLNQKVRIKVYVEGKICEIVFATYIDRKDVISTSRIRLYCPVITD